MPCCQCEGEDHVTHRCEACRGLLCRNCVTQHGRMRMFQKHRPLPLSCTQEVREQFLQEMAFCQDGNPPSGFCRTCCSAVCPECQDDHQGSQHALDSVAHALDEAHGEHRNLLAELDSRRRKLRACREAAMAADVTSRDMVENRCNQLLETRDQLLRAVHTRCSQLQAQLQEAARVQAARLDGHLAALEHSAAEVEACSDYLAMSASWTQPLQFLAVHRTHTSSVRQLLTSPLSPPALDLQPDQLRLDTSGLQRVLDVILSFGDVIEGEERVEAAPEEASSEETCLLEPHGSGQCRMPLERPRDPPDGMSLTRTESTAAPQDDTAEASQVLQLTMSSEASQVLQLTTSSEAPQVSQLTTSQDFCEEATEVTEITMEDLLRQAPALAEIARSQEASGALRESLASDKEQGVSRERPRDAKSPATFGQRKWTWRKTRLATTSMQEMERSGLQTSPASSSPQPWGADMSYSPPYYDPPEIELEFCANCVNLDGFRVREGLLVNSCGTQAGQRDHPHPHRPDPSFWGLPTPPPKCQRLRKYWGTLGNVVLGKGKFSWRVKVRVQSSGPQARAGNSSYLSELGVVPPDLGDAAPQALGMGGGWGIEVIFCTKHGGLCAKGRGLGGQAVSHEPLSEVGTLGEALVVGQRVEVHLSLAVDTLAGTLVCRESGTAKPLCEIRGVLPPLLPFFGLRHGDLDPSYSLQMEVE